MVKLTPLLLLSTEEIKSVNHLKQSKNHSSKISQNFADTKNVRKQDTFGGKYIFGNIFFPRFLAAIKVVRV